MIVRNLVAWVGPDFDRLPGEEIDLPDDVAQARIEAGLCEPKADQAKRKVMAAPQVKEPPCNQS
jgi:hypothetical protein